MLCPDCGVGRLVESSKITICPSCGAVSPKGWHRGYISFQRPLSINGVPINGGPLFASLQKAPHPQGLEGHHLMDFAIDLDFDSFEDSVNAAQYYSEQLKGEPFRLYFSGSKGFHIVVSAESLGMHPISHPHIYLRSVAKRLASPKYPIDYSIYSSRRLFRVANTVHPKTGLYKVPLLVEEIPFALELAKQPRPLITTTGKSTLLRELFEQALTEPPLPSENRAREINFTPPCMESLLYHGPPLPGTRHALLLQLAAFFVASGRTKEELMSWAADTPGASRATYRERVKDAERAYLWAEKHRPRFSCRTIASYGLCDPSCPMARRNVDWSIGG